MREIKFRAWDKKTKQMVYNIHTIYDGGIDDNELSTDGIYDTDIPTSSFGAVLNSDIPVMQFTGSKDKNGKEIYEGDIIDYDSYGYHSVGEPEWDGGMSDEAICGWVFGSRSVDPNKGEVIGNIYENPNLLKK